MAAKQFGVNSLSRSMAIILPVNTIGQTWVPYGLSWLRKQYPSYDTPMMYILGISMIGAVAILLLPRDRKEDAPPAMVAEPAAARG